MSVVKFSFATRDISFKSQVMSHFFSFQDWTWGYGHILTWCKKTYTPNVGKIPIGSLCWDGYTYVLKGHLSQSIFGLTSHECVKTSGSWFPLGFDWGIAVSSLGNGVSGRQLWHKQKIKEGTHTGERSDSTADRVNGDSWFLSLLVFLSPLFPLVLDSERNALSAL